jgi:hypothetical protein
VTATQQTIKRQLSELIELANQQLAAAADSEWERAAELEQQRQTQLRKNFSAAIAPQAADLVRAGIQTIKQLERQLLALTEQAKAETTRQLSQSQKGNKASRAYQQNK